MPITETNKTVYTCSDGKEFTSRTDAKDYEFGIKCRMNTLGGINKRQLRNWLVGNRNLILDYIGANYDPAEEKPSEPDVPDFGDPDKRIL